MEKDFLEIGQIVNTFGIKGQLKVVPFTDDMKRFDKLKRNKSRLLAKIAG